MKQDLLAASRGQGENDVDYMQTVFGEIGKSVAPKRLEPLGDAVAFRFVEPEKVGALHLPQKGETKRDMAKAIVVAVGPDCQRVKVGDQIVPWKQAAANLGVGNWTGEELGLVRECDIAALVVPDVAVEVP